MDDAGDKARSAALNQPEAQARAPGPAGGDADPARLVELLKHQNVLHRRLRLLADRQKAMVAEDDSQALLKLLADRQKLVEGLVGLNDKLAPYREKWTAIYNNLDEATRKCVADLLEEANSALGSILQSDRQDTAQLAARRQGMAGRLATVDAGSRASAAYSSAGRHVPGNVTDARV